MPHFKKRISQHKALLSLIKKISAKEDFASRQEWEENCKQRVKLLEEIWQLVAHQYGRSIAEELNLLIDPIRFEKGKLQELKEKIEALFSVHLNPDEFKSAVGHWAEEYLEESKRLHDEYCKLREEKETERAAKEAERAAKEAAQ